MNNILKLAASILIIFLVIIGLSFAFGWIGVGYTRTVGKAKQNTQREVFEETQSYVESKRQAALKYYKEYNKSESVEDKQTICAIVSQEFANFDEDKLQDRVKAFIENCKYN